MKSLLLAFALLAIVYASIDGPTCKSLVLFFLLFLSNRLC